MQADPRPGNMRRSIWYILSFSGANERMAIDPYSPCPGGTGKKLKFCCSDLVGDLEQLDRLVEGQQLSAAHEMVDRLSSRHPGKACLLSTKVKLALAERKIGEASAAASEFVAACPDNPMAMAQSALCEALVGRLQESATAFDKAREACGAEIQPEVARIAASLAQVAAQLGSVGFAQGLIEWIEEKQLASEDERRMLAARIGMAGVPAALRSRPSIENPPEDSPWRFEFERGVEQARAFRLSKALTTFRSLKGVAGDCRAVHANIAILCEMLARPFEAAEAWLKVAATAGLSADDAVDATGRAIELEQEADPDRSPTIPLVSFVGTMDGRTPEEIELLEDKLRHDVRFQPVPFDRGEWVSKNLVPPRSVWRIGEAGPKADDPQRLLASLLLFGRQTDREPEAALQGFEPDAAEAKPIVEPLLGTTFTKHEPRQGGNATTPTAWLVNTQYMVRLAEPPRERPSSDQPSIVDTIMARQRELLWDRFVAMWPEAALPELLGKTPREAIASRDGRLRVLAMIEEGEAASRQPDAPQGWTRVRERLALEAPKPIESKKPLEEVPPMRWHRVVLRGLPIDELRGMLVAGLTTGFDTAAERAAAEIVSRADATPEDRWEALSLLEERAQSTVRKLEIIKELRSIAASLKVGDGMIDAAELRVRLQRGDEADIMRLLDHVGREHGRDEKVIRAVADVLAEAGIDLSALASRGGMPAGAATAGPAATIPAAEPGKLWTPDGGAASAGRTEPGGSEKKTLWTPG
jgi:hypothetical protein